MASMYFLFNYLILFFIVDVSFGVIFFALGQVIMYSLSSQICDLAKHYVDGMFFGTICTLLSVMMVYKYWDGITKEDLEFSVGSKLNTWEIKDPLLNHDSMANYTLMAEAIKKWWSSGFELLWNICFILKNCTFSYLDQPSVHDCFSMSQFCCKRYLYFPASTL